MTPFQAVITTIAVLLGVLAFLPIIAFIWHTARKP